MVIKIIAIYLATVNLYAFSLMGIDKQKAKKHQWRISERALFISALIGGSLGANIGMRLFHHKTKHWYFVIFMPLILLVQLGLLVFLFLR